MSLKQFLVHFDDSRAAVARLNFARALATEHGGTVTALYAVTPALLEIPLAVEAGAAAMVALREVDEERLSNAREAFDNAIEAFPGVRPRWAVVDGYPVVRAFNEQALFADVVLLGQRQPSSGPSAAVPYDLAEAVVSSTGKPALVLPFVTTAATVPRIVAIAWKATREAARAVTAAIPLMRKAREVHVMAWGEAQSGGIRGSRLDLDGWLHLHGIDARWHREGGGEPGFIGEMLLTRSADLDADLLVMGCYGHSRAREWVLGGASRTVLESMTLPVLMAH